MNIPIIDSKKQNEDWRFLTQIILIICIKMHKYHLTVLQLNNIYGIIIMLEDLHGGGDTIEKAATVQIRLKKLTPFCSLLLSLSQP